MNLTTLLFSFQGRINRAKYWTVMLVYLAILIVCTVFAIIGLGISSAIPSTGASMSYLFMAIFALVCLVTMWSSIAVGIKRLHDRDQSGWWMLVFSGVSTIVSLLEETAATPGSQFILGVGSFAVTIWIIIELGFLRGTQGPNRFGSDPLEASPR
jgi:uncharacterized membrane protein YhaH (DUF805 family)